MTIFGVTNFLAILYLHCSLSLLRLLKSSSSISLSACAETAPFLSFYHKVVFEVSTYEPTPLRQLSGN